MMRHRFVVFGAAIAGFAGFGAGAEELVKYEIVDESSIPKPLTGQPGDPDRGREVVIHRQQGNCLACHEIPALADQPFHGNVGPSLAGVAKRYPEGELRLRIVDPKVVNPDTIMPAFYKNEGLHRVMPKFEGKPLLTAEQVEDAVAFLLTLDDEAAVQPSVGMALSEGRALATVEPPADSPLHELISGYEFAVPETRALQDDDFANPGFFSVDLGNELWEEVEGAADKACVSCHGDAEQTMRGVGARYPRHHESNGKVINLEQRINLCRTENMRAEAWEWESDELVGMTTYIRHQSRGMSVDVGIDGRAAPYVEKGKTFYYQRRGQLDMACAHCHEATYGLRLRANLLTQGHINGFPTYRLGWQRLGSLQRRFRDCNRLVRATPYPPGADEYINLELYLAWRGSGLPVETPAVRQ